MQSQDKEENPNEVKLARIADTEKPDLKSDLNDEKETVTTQISPSLPTITTYGSYDTPHSSPSDSEEGKYLDRSEKSKTRSSQKASSPLVIQWLQDNYDSCEGSSLPRSTLYAHYLSYCSSMNIDPVNAASFGKLIRSVFPTLKTRRLGTRGHSKYHYYGIQIKSNSELRLPTFHQSESYSESKPIPQVKPKKEFEERKSSVIYSYESENYRNGTPYESNSIPTTTATPIQLPEFTFDTLRTPSELNVEVAHFMNIYRKHCQSIVDCCFKQQFSDVEKILLTFWQSSSAQMRNLFQRSEIADQIIQKDQITYKIINHILLPNVLQALPVSVPQDIRQFAKKLEVWLTNALEGLPQEFCIRKLHVAKRFCQSLHKQASLNHLTQAARNVLQSTNQISQMIVDWNRLDFEFIRDQAMWVCQCGDDIIQSAQEEFKRFLTERASLEQWGSWLQDIVQKVLGKCTDPRELVGVAQQLLLKWTFYSNLVIRDLTVRNATSFSSFHLLRTLFDEYVFYLVDSKFASISQHPTSLYEPVVEHHVNANHSCDPFVIDTMINKDLPRMGKHLPYPNYSELSDVRERLPIQEEEYGRYDTIQQYRLPNGIPFRVFPNKPIEDQFSGMKRAVQQIYTPYPNEIRSFPTTGISSSVQMEPIVHSNTFSTNENSKKLRTNDSSSPEGK